MPPAPVSKPSPDAPSNLGPASLRLNQALSDGKAVVLLFAGDGADDKVAREVVRSVHDPRVVTVVTTIGKLGDYAALTGNLEINAAPTILVVGPDRQARMIVGLPDLKQVQSALASALPR